MKKHIQAIITSLLVIFLTSCEMVNSFYFEENKTKEIQKKTTIKTFSQLNQPIVIALPVYENAYMLGNENLGSKVVRKGDIIAVIDWETDTVYDWIFYPGEHGWSIWRLVELGENPTCYYESSVGLGQVACLNPEKTELTVVDTGLYTNFWNMSTKGNFGCLSYNGKYNQELGMINYCIQLYNGKENTYSENVLSIYTYSLGDISYFKSDPNGNFWFTYQKKDDYFHVARVDCSGERIDEDLYKFKAVEVEGSYNFFDVGYVTDDYLYITRNASGSEQEVKLPGKVYAIPYKDTSLPTKEIEIPEIMEECLYDMQKVNNEMYVIAPYAFQYIDLYTIDTESSSYEYKARVNDFDMTETVWVRDSRIYFMNSRNTSDVKYTYYDTADGKIGSVIEVSVDKIISDYHQ